MKYLILLISILLIGGLIGCSTQTKEEKEKICETNCINEGWQYGNWIGLSYCNCHNETIIINKTRTIFNETIKYVNKTLECTESNYSSTTSSTTSKELELIRRLKFLENQQDKYFNDSECNWELNRSNVELENCEEEICEWNSSWC